MLIFVIVNNCFHIGPPVSMHSIATRLPLSSDVFRTGYAGNKDFQVL